MIQFPDEELASEYVLPVFDRPQAVLDRNVSLTKRFEFLLSTGLRVDEPLYHVLGLSGSMVFHWSEFSGLGISGLFFMPGLSPTGYKLQTKGIDVEKKVDDKSVKKKVYFDPLLAPHPLFASFLNYYFTPLYGKVSITKKVVFNFNLYSFIGAGVIAFKHGSSNLVMDPAGHIGIGQKSYFNRHIALTVGMNLMFYRGPNPISPLLMKNNITEERVRPKFDQFKKAIFVRFLVRAGLAFLI